MIDGEGGLEKEKEVEMANTQINVGHRRGKTGYCRVLQ